MGKEEIVARILSDAEEEAEAILAEAKKKAEATLAAAGARAEELRAAARRDTAERCAAIRAGKEAEKRLDCSKIALAARRRVLDEVYARAFNALVSLDKKQTLALSSRLLEAFAEEGDEILLAQNYPCAEELLKLPVVTKKKLKISPRRVAIAGGFTLCGKISDTDLSYPALLAADREALQAELAQALFQTK